MPVSLTVEQFEAIRAIDSPTIANAIEPFNVRPHASGYVGHDIRCLIPGLGTMLGYAVTCTADSRTEWRRREDSSFLDLCRAVQAAPKPAVVVIQDVGQDRDRSLPCRRGHGDDLQAARCGGRGGRWWAA